MDKKKKKILDGIFIAAGVSLIGLGAIRYLKSKSKAIIADIDWNSREDNVLELSWYDEDDENQVYTIFISETRNINVKDEKTYKEKIHVTSLTHKRGHFNHSFKVETEWIYFVISKDGYVSSEFEAHVKHRPKFCIEKLRPRIIVRNNKFGYTVISLNVLPGFDKYRLYHYFSPGEVEQTDYNVKEEESVLLKIKPTEWSVGFISAIKSGIEEKLQFLFVGEKVYERNKWETTTLIL